MRINLFTLGDCTDPNTWSNLPYYFYRGLIAHAIDVAPLDLTPPAGIVHDLCNRVVRVRARALSAAGLEAPHDRLRARWYHALVNRHIKSLIRTHRNADLNLFLTFTFSTVRYSGTPVAHFCDRTYEHHLEDVGRTPTAGDRAFIQIDRWNIERAALVLTTNQPCADFITSRYGVDRVFCLAGGNSTDADVSDPDALIDSKQNATDVLFIGRGAHSRGVDILIRAFERFNERCGGRFTLQIVGVQPEELPEELRGPHANIRFHGYLDRTVPDDLRRYNALIQSARMFVMPMRPGPYPGVIREVQLHCTPVIVSNVPGRPEIVIDGHNGVVVDGLEPEAFASCMHRLIEEPERWRRMALNSHLGRRDITWVNTANDFVNILRDCDLLRNHSAGRIDGGH